MTKKYMIEFRLSDGTIRMVPIEIPLGPEGKPGESAWEAAVKAGYPGTEEQFYQDLSKISDVHQEAVLFVKQELTEEQKAQARANIGVSEGGGDVDLAGYATEEWVQEGYQPKGEYLTDDTLSDAIDTALAEAKESGEFDYVLTNEDKQEIADAIDNPAIIDVVALPTEDIREDVFYRQKRYVFVHHAQVLSNWKCIIVSELPEIGSPVLTSIPDDLTKANVTAYLLPDDSVYGYVNAEVATAFGITVGWYAFDLLLEKVGSTFGGVTSRAQAGLFGQNYIWLVYDPVLYEKYAASEFDSLIQVTYPITTGGGLGTVANGTSAAIGQFATSFGLGCEAGGKFSHASGELSYSTGLRAFAHGIGVRSEGDNSSAFGWYTSASSHNQLVCGRSNIPDSNNKYIFIAGNGGAGEDGGSHTNAHTLDWSGNAWFQGDVYVGGSGQEDEAAQKLATEAYVNEHAGSGGSSVQPDWNQNDSTADDYVKNRPFYEEATEVVMLDNVTMDCTEKRFFTMSESDFAHEFTEGNTYTVTVNGAEYSCVAYSITNGSETVIVIGNGSIAGMTGGNNEPFIAYVVDRTFFTMFSENGTYTVTIKGTVTTIKKLDEKFIPEGEVVGKNVEGQTFTVPDADFNETSVVAGAGAEVFNDYKYTIASGKYSHAEGWSTMALGVMSHAECAGTIAFGDYSHVEGEDTRAIGDHSHAEGHDTIASGDASHAEGINTVASGYASHTEGNLTGATGHYSHAEGNGTIAASESQHAQGKFNIEDSAGTYAHIVGNGTSDTDRSNAHTLDWSGNAWFAGGIELNSPDGTRYRITVADGGTLTVTAVTE